MPEIDLGSTLPTSPDEDVKGAIKKVFEQIEASKEEYFASVRMHNEKFDTFLESGKSLSETAGSFISILRKWNSYTPILPREKEYPKGGGYFIYHKGVGIVIDPGISFLNNFYDNKFRLDDIDVVILSHAHNDHTVDLESIFTLLHRRNKKYEERKQFEKIKKIDVYLNLGSFKKFSGLFDLSREGYPNYIQNIVLLDSHCEYKILKDNRESDIILYTMKVQHHETITHKYALGFIFKFGDNYVRFTGDTGWNEDIETENDKYMEDKQIDKIDILVIHLGTIKESEFNFDFAKSIKDNSAKGGSVYYKQHLGILGSICMIKRHKPNFSIFSEFGEELKSIRKKLVDEIASAIGVKAIPGDIGLHVQIEDGNIFCMKSGNMVPYEEIETFSIDSNICYASKSSFGGGERIAKEDTLRELISRNQIKSFHDRIRGN